MARLRLFAEHAYVVVSEPLNDLPELITGRPDYRILISAGSLVTAFTVVGQLASDGSVELVDLDIDLNPPPPTEEPP